MGATKASDLEEQKYWSRWSDTAYTKFDALRAAISWNENEEGTFTADADVPDWLREATAGQLVPSGFPSLSLAMVWDPVDWPTLIEAHPGDLRLLGEGVNSTYVPWEVISTAYRAIESAGRTPSLHVLLEIDFDGALSLEPGSLKYKGDDDDPALIMQVDAIFAPNVSFRRGMWQWG